MAMDFSFSYEEDKPPPKPRPLQSKAFLTKDPLARTEQDTVAAWRNWDLRVYGNALWPDNEERRQLLADLGEKAGDDRRLQALVRLRSLSTGADGARLWADEELRRGLLACANAGANAEYLAKQEEPQELRCVALGVLLQVMRVQENRAALLRDAAARAVVLLAMKKTHGVDVNSRAALLYVGLLVEAVRTESIRDYEDFLRAFKNQQDPELPPEGREALFGALWSVATSDAADVRRLWKSEIVRPLLLQAAGPEEESLEVRCSALGVIWSLSGENDFDKEVVWNNEDARLAIVAGLRGDQRIDIRRTAMNALASFAAVPSLRASIWQEVGRKSGDEEEEALLPGEEPPPPLADELRASVEEGQPVDVRLSALRTLVDLSFEEAVQRSMAWSGPMCGGVHTLLYRAVDDQSIDVNRRRYYRFAYGRIAPLAPEVFALAMVRDRLTRFLLSERLWLPEPRWWDAMGIVKSELRKSRRNSWAGVLSIVKLKRGSLGPGPSGQPTGNAASDEDLPRVQTDGVEHARGRRASVSLGDTKALQSISRKPLVAVAEATAPSATGSGGEAPEITGHEHDETGADKGVEEMPEFVPEPEVPEYIDLGNVTKCLRARVMQPDAPDRRIGSILGVARGTLEVTVQWWDTTYDELEVGELSYIDPTKKGDPAEVPIAGELEGLKMRSRHGRVGTVTSCFSQPRQAGERQAPITARIKWDPHICRAKELGPGGALVFIRSQDMRLLSRSIMEYIVPGPPPRPPPPPTPPDVEEVILPPPQRMKGRCEFEEEEDYQRYVRDMFKSHGKEVGAQVQFVDDVPFWGATKGMYGIIKEFTSLEAIRVKWDSGELMWVDMSRCQLQKTADEAFIWTEALPEPNFVGGGGISGPSASEIVTFEGAPAPVLRKWVMGTKLQAEHAAFTLFVQLRCTAKRQQHFVEWGSADGTRKALVLRLTEDGNFEYGEHIGSVSQGWRATQLSPKRNLCDGKWHSIGFVRRDTGFVWMYVDDELAGQGIIGANLPPGLAPSPKSYRNIKQDFVFHGDVGPLYVWSTELTINQIRAVNLLAGIPKL